MSAVAAATDRSALATQVVERFLNAHRRGDVAAMVALCDEDAELRYPGFEAWGKQRVVHGNGKAHTIGRVIWTGMVAAFPDIGNEVRSIDAGVDGDVVAEVLLTGTQAGPWGVVGGSGKSFAVPQLFVFQVSKAGLIEAIAAYWDNASLYRQLGHAEVD